MATPNDMPKPKEKASEDDSEQTYTAHVVDGTVKARVKSEDWAKYAKDNNL